MDEKLTTTERKTSDYRIAYSDYHADSHAGSTTPPNRARESGHQEAQLGSSSIGRFWPATVGAARTEGASQSKWTRKTRSWNAKPQTTVVASIKAGEPDPERISLMPRRPYGSVGSIGVLRPYGRRRWQGYSGRSRPISCPSWAAASTAPPSSVRLGGGDRENQSPALD